MIAYRKIRVRFLDVTLFLPTTYVNQGGQNARSTAAHLEELYTSEAQKLHSKTEGWETDVS